MIGTLIGVIFALVIARVIWWGIQQLLALVPLAEPFQTIIRIVMMVILVLIVLWACAALLGMAGIHVRTFQLGGLVPQGAANAASGVTVPAGTPKQSRQLG